MKPWINPDWSTYLKAYLPPIIWGGVIFLLSDQEVLPGFDVSVVDFVAKKMAHIFVYAVLYLLLYRAVRTTLKTDDNGFWWVLPLIICLIYAIVDELHQSTVPGRQATLRDVGYDMLGASIALLRKLEFI